MEELEEYQKRRFSCPRCGSRPVAVALRKSSAFVICKSCSFSGKLNTAYFRKRNKGAKA